MKSQLLYGNLLLLFLASLNAIITGAIFYFEEGRHNFGFLTDSSELSIFILMYVLVTIIPIAIYFLTKTSKYSRLSIYFALIV